jgi:hypothetical protein
MFGSMNYFGGFRNLAFAEGEKHIYSEIWVHGGTFRCESGFHFCEMWVKKGTFR